MNRKEQAIRRLAAARRRGDFDEVRSLLADEIVWHEPGDADYSGDHRGADDVVALIKKVSEIPLVLEPQEVFVTDEHAAARTRWWAERADTRVEGNEVAVYRFQKCGSGTTVMTRPPTTSSSPSTRILPNSSAVLDF